MDGYLFILLFCIKCQSAKLAHHEERRGKGAAILFEALMQIASSSSSFFRYKKRTALLHLFVYISFKRRPFFQTVRCEFEIFPESSSGSDRRTPFKFHIIIRRKKKKKAKEKLMSETRANVTTATPTFLHIGHLNL